jgi:hypothetical protein
LSRKGKEKKNEHAKEKKSEHFNVCCLEMLADEGQVLKKSSAHVNPSGPVSCESIWTSFTTNTLTKLRKLYICDYMLFPTFTALLATSFREE